LSKFQIKKKKKRKEKRNRIKSSPSFTTLTFPYIQYFESVFAKENFDILSNYWR